MTELKRPVAKTAFFLCVCAAFVATGVWMVIEGEPWGWLSIGFFGFGVIAFTAFLFGNMGLTLDAEGFEVRTLFRRKRYRWAEVSEFSIMHVQSTSEIMFDDLRIMDRWFARMTRFFLGRNSSIPGVLISGPVEEACATFNDARASALRGRA
ncbi:MAG: PH domain-containing protein [Hyphomonadaceae bacterium]|nr:PH domain-containing protein [Hyphomonadaceae bacterium]